MVMGVASVLSEAATAAGMTSVVYDEAPVTFVSVMTSAVMSRCSHALWSWPWEKIMALAVSAVGEVWARCGSLLSLGMRLPSVYHVRSSLFVFSQVSLMVCGSVYFNGEEYWW